MRNSWNFVDPNVLSMGIMLVGVQQQGESFVDMQDAHLVGLVISWGKLTRLRFPDRHAGQQSHVTREYLYTDTS
jgi:hypothetical protein